MRGGKTATRFKKSDFIDEAWDRMRSGRGFFGGLGYKGYDEQGALDSAIKNIAKFNGKSLYVFATYTGIKTNTSKPPYGQQYYRVNPDGSADYVEYSKGITTEKQIRSRHKAKVESSFIEPTQIALFGTKFNPDVTENQIRARLIQPIKIIKGTYFVRQSTTPGVSYVMGKDKSRRVMTQSIRFDRNMYNNSEAKRWFNSNIKRIKQVDRQGYTTRADSKMP